ncbi:hypothetical protein [Faecalimicrobium dakarense]|uniref:hypothetical protein n=1 Tax=Faecalimicrobium dakarense TaxID=1301100 RepID=UPI0004BCF0BB|nr:hypothetical protein [[Clostridium] dakarense]
MQTYFLSEDKIFIQPTKLAEILLQSNGYTNFHESIVQNNIEYSDQKNYEISSGGFIDFNQHLYENINEMNSISTGIYLEKSLITFRIFIWGAKGEGFEIFKHVLRGEEINNLQTIEDLKEYIYIHINELEQGIMKTYGEDTNKAFEQFGLAIESRKLPLQSILQYLSIENNMQDFR